jgi:phosphoenolpyruvate synthase/pyruvate phosphate dikinase
VVLQRTVNGDKSGVLATANLKTMAADELTANVSEGVAAVVDGGVAESLLLRPDGSVRLLAQGQSGYKRVALKEGGFRMEPTSGNDSVLTPEEIQKVRQLAADVDSKLTRATGSDGKPLPWDIEFGFEKGELRLFQIRPLVRFQEASTLAALGELEGGNGNGTTVDLAGWGDGE